MDINKLFNDVLTILSKNDFLRYLLIIGIIAFCALMFYNIGKCVGVWFA